jgi:transcriptional regulator
MYMPPAFAETRLPVLHEAIRHSRLTSLVTLNETGLEASQVPVLVDPTEGEFGTIYGHLARANPQWRGVQPTVPALAIATGPDAYISPSWYATKQQTGKVVPTWNYVVVHAYGGIEFIEEAEGLLAIVTRLTNHHEGKRAEPWSVSDAPGDFIQAQLKGIVGFKLAITRIEGKWKLSQNRSAEDRSGVIAGLQDGGGPAERAIAGLMTSD